MFPEFSPLRLGLELVGSVVQAYIYIVYGSWATLMNGVVGLLEAVDEWVEEFDIVDNAILRMGVMGVVGFFVSVGLTLVVLLFTGNWAIVCLFVLMWAFCVFLGLIADPDADWQLPSPPSFLSRRGPRTPLNL